MQSDVDINWQNENGVSALMCACVAGQTKFVKLLLGKQAKPELQDDSGFNALHCAVWGGVRAGFNAMNVHDAYNSISHPFHSRDLMGGCSYWPCLQTFLPWECPCQIQYDFKLVIVYWLNLVPTRMQNV